MQPAPSIVRRLRWISRLAWLTFLLVFLVTSLSAWLRLSGRLPGCEPWPDCQQIDATVSTARALHRVAASASLVAIIAMLILASLPRPVLHAQRLSAWLLLALALFLAVLGAVTGRSQATGVVLGNLLGGMLMLGLSIQLSQARVAASSSPHEYWVNFVIVLTLVQMALGGLAGQTEAPLSMVHALHLLVAVLLISVLTAGAWRLVSQGRHGLAGLMLALATLQIGLGTAMLVTETTVLIATLHNMVAGGLLASLFYCRSQPGRHVCTNTIDTMDKPS